MQLRIAGEDIRRAHLHINGRNRFRGRRHHARVAAVKTLSDYNKALKTADDLLNKLKGQEKDLNTWSSRALNGVKFKYGDDSFEYEMAGGSRESERNKPVRKPKGA